ncbi:MAG: hypothetical protein HQM08_11875 [Candidatus Riflebacteria bacterium]|nr:hypothetical protein [Candidatus Riflebacteria bacterium]
MSRKMSILRRETAITIVIFAFLFSVTFLIAEDAASTEMHNLPQIGRLRINVPSVYHNSKVGEDIVKLIKPLDVTGYYNPDTGSVEVNYPPNTDVGNRVLKTLNDAGYIDQATLNNLAAAPSGVAENVGARVGKLVGDELVDQAVAQVGLSVPVKLMDMWSSTEYPAYTFNTNVPGRIRVKSPDFKYNEWLSGKLPAALKESVPGLQSAEMDPITGTLLVTFDPTKATHENVLQTLQTKGLYDSSKAISNEEYLAQRVDMLGKKLGNDILKDKVQTAIEQATGLPIGKLSKVYNAATEEQKGAPLSDDELIKTGELGKGKLAFKKGENTTPAENTSPTGTNPNVDNVTPEPTSTANSVAPDSAEVPVPQAPTGVKKILSYLTGTSNRRYFQDSNSLTGTSQGTTQTGVMLDVAAQNDTPTGQPLSDSKSTLNPNASTVTSSQIVPTNTSVGSALPKTEANPQNSPTPDSSSANSGKATSTGGSVEAATPQPDPNVQPKSPSTPEFAAAAPSGAQAGLSNAKLSLINGFSPKNVAITAGITIGVDLIRQAASGEKIDLMKAVKTVATAEFAGGVVGSTIGAAAGAGVAPFLNSIPIAGGILAALAPVTGSVIGYAAGSAFAGETKNGTSISAALKDAFTKISWASVAGQSIGSTVGMFLGSSLGPVGTIVGGMVGGYLGDLAARYFTQPKTAVAQSNNIMPMDDISAASLSTLLSGDSNPYEPTVSPMKIKVKTDGGPFGN